MEKTYTRNADWEWQTEKYAWFFFPKKYNKYDYVDTKTICEEEVMRWMHNKEDRLPKVKERIRYRLKHKLVYISTYEQIAFLEKFTTKHA